MRCAAYVLTGGQSRRMGRDKALLPLDGRPLALHQVSLAATVAHPVALVGEPARYTHLGVETLDENYPGCGPLSGIEAALRLHRAEWNLILACDLLGADQSVLTALLAAAGDESAAGVVAAQSPDQSPNPLCALWHTRALPVVAAALAAGRYRVRDAAAEAGVRAVPTPALLHNINTPQDWAEAAP